MIPNKTNSNKRNEDWIWKIKKNEKERNWKIFIIWWGKCVLIFVLKKCDLGHRCDWEKK